MTEISTIELLKELSERGGHPGALADAALLAIKKSADYNGNRPNLHNIDRSNYFPFDELSYAQMIHTKSQRFNSLCKKLISKEPVQFEGLRDTALDLINYAGFYIDYSQRKEVL